MKLETSPEGKTVIDDHEDNFAIVFAAMGVSLQRGGREWGMCKCVLIKWCSRIFSRTPLIWMSEESVC